MARLEDLQAGTRVKGLAAGVATAGSVRWSGDHAVTVIFRDEQGQGRVNVGFARMTLQRRLASSPGAIFRSLTRRCERLESKLREQRLLLQGKTVRVELADSVLSGIDDESVDDDADEVLARLAALPGAKVDVTLEINVTADDVIRTVSENANTLGFDHASFEE